ncbi:MAG: hypothetical protein C5B49_14930 [Bdellovibrio sp.]|nr:MAG: hypothetical protein C5B49_14930 [Bdellovibrio sp.]
MQSGYTIYQINNAKAPSFASSLTLIQSKYRDFNQIDVQMFERQYVIGDKLYAVTYLEDAAVVDNRGQIQNYLDYFVPVPEKISRNPSSEFGKETAAGGSVFNARSNANPWTIQDLDMSRPENIKECEAFCKEDQSKCRKPGMAGFWDDINVSKLIYNCFKGLAQGIWGMAEGIWDLVKFGWKYAKSGITGDGYMTQVHAAVGAAASELWKNRAKIPERIAVGLWNAAKKTLGNFFLCASNAEQFRQVCLVGSNFLPLGIIWKMVTHAPMTAAELAEVDAAFLRGKMRGLVMNKSELPQPKIKIENNVASGLSNDRGALSTLESNTAFEAASGRDLRSRPARSGEATARAVEFTYNSPLGSVHGWQTTVEVAPLTRRASVNETERIDRALKSTSDPDQAIRNLQTIAKENRTEQFLGAMEAHAATGNAAEDDAWLIHEVGEISTSGGPVHSDVAPVGRVASSGRSERAGMSKSERAAAPTRPVQASAPQVREGQAAERKTTAKPTNDAPRERGSPGPLPLTLDEIGPAATSELAPTLSKLTPGQKKKIETILRLGGEQSLRDLRRIAGNDAQAGLKRVLIGEEMPWSIGDRSERERWLVDKVHDLAADLENGAAAMAKPRTYLPTRIAAMRKSYPVVSKLPPADADRLIESIADLEKSKIPHKKINQNLNQAERMCLRH